jgi:hypothetical protein
MCAYDTHLLNQGSRFGFTIIEPTTTTPRIPGMG